MWIGHNKKQARKWPTGNVNARAANVVSILNILKWATTRRKHNVVSILNMLKRANQNECIGPDKEMVISTRLVHYRINKGSLSKRCRSPSLFLSAPPPPPSPVPAVRVSRRSQLRPFFGWSGFCIFWSIINKMSGDVVATLQHVPN